MCKLHDDETLYFQHKGKNVHDFKIYIDIISHIKFSDDTIFADKAYGTCETLNYIQMYDANYAITLKSNTLNHWNCYSIFYKECTT